MHQCNTPTNAYTNAALYPIVMHIPMHIPMHQCNTPTNAYINAMPPPMQYQCCLLYPHQCTNAMNTTATASDRPAVSPTQSSKHGMQQQCTLMQVSPAQPQTNPLICQTHAWPKSKDKAYYKAKAPPTHACMPRAQTPLQAHICKGRVSWNY